MISGLKQIEGRRVTEVRGYCDMNKYSVHHGFTLPEQDVDSLTGGAVTGLYAIASELYLTPLHVYRVVEKDDTLDDLPDLPDLDEEKYLALTEKLIQQYTELQQYFTKATGGLRVSLAYHDKIGCGSRWDQVNDVFWRVDGCLAMTPAAIALGPVLREVAWISLG